MKRLSVLFSLLFLLLTTAVLHAKDDTFYFFYSDTCPHCREAHPFIEELAEKHPETTFKSLEVSNNSNNRDLFRKKVASLNIAGVGVPLFVHGNSYEVGYKDSEQYHRRIHQLLSHAEPADLDFYFFYSHRCPHCQEAHPFIRKMEKQYDTVTFHELEIVKNSENRKLFKKMVSERNIQSRGVPTFIMGSDSIVGFRRGTHDEMIRKMIEKHISRAKSDACTPAEKRAIDIPFLGKIDPEVVSLPSFTFIIGLLDGVNPCAMWVLMFLLTLLVNARSRKKILLIGGVFVSASAVVYFLFMTAWLNFFTFLGITSVVTIGLGILAIIMGLINIKEFFFFKQGVSLMIPDKFKPKLFEKMRSVMNARNSILSILGTIALAFFVNLIELGCTVGLPAIYTRVLSIQDIHTVSKYMYMALYNIYYVIPLAVIVSLFALTMGKFRFHEKHARVLKLVSGALMLGLGLILVIKPDLLVFS